MEDETGAVATKEFVGLKSKMYLFLLHDSSAHKKAKCVNKNFVVTINHGEYKGVFSNNKCLRHLINRTQSPK